MDIANLVQATAGREQGKYFFVLETDGEYLLLADGKSRRIEAPKRKKQKHVRFIAESAAPVAEKIRSHAQHHIPSRHWKWTHDLSAYFRKAQNEFHQDSAR